MIVGRLFQIDKEMVYHCTCINDTHTLTFNCSQATLRIRLTPDTGVHGLIPKTSYGRIGEIVQLPDSVMHSYIVQKGATFLYKNLGL